MERVAVIDFETTGLSPDQGDRVTEIAAVLVEDGRVVDRYQLRDVSHELLREIQKVQKRQLDKCMERYRRQAAGAQ